MPDGPLIKARIQTIEGPHLEVECLFNPKEYLIQRSNSWGPVENSKTNASDLTFSGSSGAKLNLQLFFDTYLRSGDGKGAAQTPQDVRVYTDKLWQMMNIQGVFKTETDKSRPPRVLFSWGKNWLFNAVITTMQQQYTLFTPSGMPVRAMVTAEFQESLEHLSLMAANSGSEAISAALRTKVGSTFGDLRTSYGR